MVSDSANQAAAQAVLLTLSSIVGLGKTAAFRLSDEGATMSFSEAAAVLASLDKPVECSGTAEGSCVRVAIGKISKEHKRLHRIHSSWATGSDEGPVPERCLREDAESVLLEAGNETILLSPQAIRMWLRDYFIAHRLAIIGYDPDSEQGDRGICWVVKVSRGDARLLDPSDIERLAPDLRDSIKHYVRELNADDD